MTTIKLKNGSGAPTAGDLAQGEPALDLTNKRLYTEDSGGTVIEVGTNPGTDVTFADNRKAIFGAGSDLQIYHSGSHSIIDEAGNGDLYLRSTNGDAVWIYSGGTTSSKKRLAAKSTGEVELYYGSTARLATTSTGIDVTGTVKGDALVINGGASSPTHLINGTRAGTLVSIDNESTGTSNGLLLNTASTSANSNVLQVTSNDVDRLKVAGNGDISFYEDTGTTAKLFWDASAESLGIGTSSPSASYGTLTVAGTGITINEDNAAKLQIGRYNASNPHSYIKCSPNSSGFKFSNASDTADLMVIENSGNVGIGTSSPAFAGSRTGINIKGTTANGVEAILLDSTDSGNAGFALIKDGVDSYVWNRTNGVIGFGTNNTERMRIDSSGNVGIGTSPSQKLHVVGTSRPALIGSDNAVNIVKLYNSATGSGSYNGLDFIVNSTSNAQISAYGMPLTFGTSASNGTDVTERMRIDSSGNWMLGTTDSNLYTSSTENGLYVTSTGQIRNSVGAVAAYLNRTGSDGDIVSFRKDGTPVGSIGVKSSDLYIGTGDTGLAFYDYSTENAILPHNPETNAFTDASIDLGRGTSGSAYRFKDLYLSGNALITTASGVSKYFNVKDGTNGGDIRLGIEAGVNNDGFVGTFTNNNFLFYTNSTERMRIDASGNLLVGATSAQGRLTVRQDSTTASPLFIVNAAVSGKFASFEGNGAVQGSITWSGSTTSYNTSSDQRLKENIVDAPSASDDIDAIQVRSFDWKADGSHQKYGMVAQELNTVAPEAVSAPEDPEDMMGVDYSKLVPMLVKEIQSLRARVAELENN